MLANENGQSAWVGGHNLLYQNLDRAIDERDTTEKLEYLLALETIGVESADTVTIEKIELNYFSDQNFLSSPMKPENMDITLFYTSDIMHRIYDEPWADSFRQEIQNAGINNLAELQRELDELEETPQSTRLKHQQACHSISEESSAYVSTANETALAEELSDEPEENFDTPELQM